MTTLGRNIKALEVEGTFDDCQKLVKQAFTDKDLNAGTATDIGPFHQYRAVDSADVLLLQGVCATSRKTVAMLSFRFRAATLEI